MAANSKIRPVFIFSAPRSGSTLLQRVLMEHSKIDSVSEPWLLLPLVFMNKDYGTLSIYSHKTCKLALDDLIRNMKGGVEEYNRYISDFVMSVYASVCNENSKYFIDKTPRYYWIIPHIAEIFPDAKFIFLFRNPVSIYASIIKTWGKGTLKYIFHHKQDLYEGITLLSDNYRKISKYSCAIKYEDFVDNPVETLKSILEYLDIDYEEDMLDKFSRKKMKGRMGDKTGTERYNTIVSTGKEKWKTVFNNRFRRRIIYKYINRLPEGTLETQGYSKTNILEQIISIDVVFITPLIDYIHFIASSMAIRFRLNLLIKKYTVWANGRYLD